MRKEEYKPTAEEIKEKKQVLKDEHLERMKRKNPPEGLNRLGGIPEIETNPQMREQMDG